MCDTVRGPILDACKVFTLFTIKFALILIHGLYVDQGLNLSLNLQLLTLILGESWPLEI